MALPISSQPPTPSYIVNVLWSNYGEDLMAPRKTSGLKAYRGGL